MPNHYDLPGYRVLGKRWAFAVTVTADGTTPYDLTGATVSAAIGTSPGATPMLQKSSPHADIVIDPDQAGVGKGKVTIVWKPDETAEFIIPASGQLYYEINVTPGGNATLTDAVAEGMLRVHKTMIRQ